jgi:hypothetical protein
LAIVVIILAFNQNLGVAVVPIAGDLPSKKEKPMRKTKSLIAASVLGLSISTTALAGEMQGPGFTEPPPPPPSATSASTAGELTEATTAELSAADAIAETAILMMQLFASIL